MDFPSALSFHPRRVELLKYLEANFSVSQNLPSVTSVASKATDLKMPYFKLKVNQKPFIF